MEESVHRQREAGIALLVVMVGLAVVGVLALGLILATKSGMQMSSYTVASSEVSSFVDAVVLQTSTSLLDTSIAGRPRIDGIPQSIEVMGDQVVVTVASEFGKIDLNAADVDTLRRLLEAAQEGPSESAEEASQIVSWRSGESVGAGPHPFRTVDEVLQVPGIKIDLYNRIRGALTVYSGRSRIDQSTSPLLALEAIPGMDHLSAIALIHDRSEDGFNNRLGEVSDGKLVQGINIYGWSFSITSDFTFGGRFEHAEEVVRMTGDPTRPYYVLWRQEVPD